MSPFTDADYMNDDTYEPEKFPQPRTYPNGRNVENSASEWAKNVVAKAKAKDDESMNWEPEKFPKPIRIRMDGILIVFLPSRKWI